MNNLNVLTNRVFLYIFISNNVDLPTDIFNLPRDTIAGLLNFRGAVPALHTPLAISLDI